MYKDISTSIHFVTTIIIDTKNQILFGILQNNEPVLLMSKLILLKAIQLMIF